ncbi:hypothetical protein [Pseudoneobacillus rhizosphaerae]|uniref:Uncharacterized protein n=1 Tax=Pseudoneobacillus rhizosphaerae TaxID=2880968 RepID=A0A9C7GAS7_9BACI|nr:hypothetical protein [Pseudoneobacillus rhizosphaerae]CAG9608893.1 hypothetical protein NEOCIP111885_02611 [Pseudoneobacillus rhizosphaerae]
MRRILAIETELVKIEMEGIEIRIKTILSILLSLLIIAGCANDENAEVAMDSEVTSTVTNTNMLKIVLTTEEFNSMFKKKSDETQYKDGKFELMDGTLVTADFYSYGVSSLFEYATAVFYKEELASLHLITTVGIDQIEEALNMNFEELALVEPTENGYQIIFDSMFHDTNISVYPFEWK